MDQKVVDLLNKEAVDLYLDEINKIYRQMDDYRSWIGESMDKISITHMMCFCKAYKKVTRLLSSIQTINIQPYDRYSVAIQYYLFCTKYLEYYKKILQERKGEEVIRSMRTFTIGEPLTPVGSKNETESKMKDEIAGDPQITILETMSSMIGNI